MIGTFGSPNIAVGTNIGDQAAPGVAIVGLVSIGSSIIGCPDAGRNFYHTSYYFYSISCSII